MTLAAGVRLGPYEIVGPLGAGGMGEVFRARDTRLGREVALKLLPEEVAADPDRLRRFEQEARATAALSHPNILAVFDVGSHDGRPFLVEELLEGDTLAERIRSGDLTVGRGVALAVQVARGLEAAHEKGIVHRDLKPDNLFVTANGVVKILDFGLAKLVATSSPDQATLTAGSDPSEAGRVVGTPAYMAPEQARGREVDHRADLFALGVVLFEVLAGMRPFLGDSYADTVSAILTRDPPPLPPSVPRAVQGIVSRCLEKRPEDRFTTARDVAYALEAALESTPERVMTQRREEPRPYPGLAAFTEADAERFFGREEEVAALWRKLPERSMLALIGPSGAGKTSFARAGLVAHAPPRWRCLVATPGQSPFSGLARALAAVFAGDVAVMQQLIEFDRPEVGPALVARWAEGSDGALVVIDQAEELFTLNGEEVQARFAELLGRLAELPGVHVLLSLRDDFLFRCNAHQALKPVFFDLTPLGPPTDDALRRALQEPARRLGFTFEDDALVDEMLAAVEGERGALPLLAFAVSRLWEERDRKRKLLTRDAYVRIGGVAGALARHAETTLENLGEASLPLVRELFRNLATGQQTRSVLEWDELLSVFPGDQRGEAEWVLAALIDARLLTSFEVEGADGAWHHRVELVHESLLQSWPRLVRWQAQDEEGAVLRDQLRQAARLWEERGRPEDLLWSGNAVTEYRLWRERYPGGLSAVEEAFGTSMVAFAGRRRRTRRLLFTAAVTALAIGLSVTAVQWRRAEAEAALREAEKLVALGRLQLGEAPTTALAYAIASLQRADNEAARRFAVEALATGPPARFIADPVIAPLNLRWSPDGHHLAVGCNQGLHLFDRANGQHRQLSSSFEGPQGFTSDGRWLLSVLHGTRSFQVWSLPEGRLERTITPAEGEDVWFVGDRLHSWLPQPDGSLLHRNLPLDGSAPETLGGWRPAPDLAAWTVDRSGRLLLTLERGRIIERRLDDLAAAGRLIGAHEGAFDVFAQTLYDRAVTFERPDGGARELRVWDLPGARLERTLSSPGFGGAVDLDPEGRFLAASATGAGQGKVALFDLDAPPAAEPTLLEGTAMPYLNTLLFSPDGRWLERSDAGTVTLWSMTGPHPTVLSRQQGSGSCNLAFTPDGDLLSMCGDKVIRRWAMAADGGPGVEEIWSRPGAWIEAPPEVDRGGRFAVVSEAEPGRVHVVPLDGSEGRTYAMGLGEMALSAGVPSLGPDGRRVALGVGSRAHPEHNALRVIDLETGEQRTLDTHPVDSERCAEAGSWLDGSVFPIWLPDGRLVSYGDGGLRLWDLTAGTSRMLRGCRTLNGITGELRATPDSQKILRLDLELPMTSSLWMFDLASGMTHDLTAHGTSVSAFNLSPTGTILVTGDGNGLVRVGPLAGGEPHLLFGHTAMIWMVAVSPDERWIAAAAVDGTIRLWPMPDLSKPPLHTLPHGELLATLESLTNLRAVPDPSADSGWKVEVGPFPGCADVPEWQP